MQFNINSIVGFYFICMHDFDLDYLTIKQILLPPTKLLFFFHMCWLLFTSLIGCVDELWNPSKIFILFL